jgi:nitrile hydratase
VDGIHDLGGLEGFGPVVRGPADEPPFPEAWHGRVHGMVLALGVAGKHSGSFRYAVERIDPAEYLATSYYEHWLHAAETMLVEGGHLAPGDVDARLTSGGGRLVRHDEELASRVRALFGQADAEVWDGPAPTYAAGDRVRVRSHFPRGHNRCPRYVRGRTGTVEAVLPASPLNDLYPEGRLEPHPVYRVVFGSEELWGPTAEAFTLRIDLFEPYLDGPG